MKKMLVLVALVAITLSAIAQDIRGNYAIKNVQTGMLLRVKDARSQNGTPLVTYYPENWKCMTWNFKNTGANTYQLQNLLTRKTFQPATAVAANVAFEEQPLIADDARQQFEFVKVKKDVYLIKLKGTNLYITPADDKGSVNSAIILAEKSGSSLQQWTIYEQAPTI